MTKRFVLARARAWNQTPWMRKGDLRLPGSRLLLRDLELVRFDGNQTDDLRSWFFPLSDSWVLEPGDADKLMHLTGAGGDLSWVIIPPAGYRM